MANIGMTFDANQVAPNEGSPPPLPTDWYLCMITDSEMLPTKADPQNSAYLKITHKVLDGPYAGRIFWNQLNLYNQNPVAVEIAQKDLSAICHAVQVYQVQDSSVLHGKPLMARLVETDPKDGYDAGNDVKGYAAQGAKESKNSQGIKLDPRNSGKPTTPPAQPGAPNNGQTQPNFTPPWAGQEQPAGQNPNPTTPSSPPANPPAQPAQNPAQPANPPANPGWTPPANPNQPAPNPTPPTNPNPPTNPAPAGGGGAPVAPPWAK